MEIRHHNKLVRDGVLAELELKGIEYTWAKVKNAHLKYALLDKLDEEVKEVRAAKGRRELIEELGDVVEVCYAIARHLGAEAFDVEMKRVLKLMDKGSFDNGDFLLTTKGGV